MEGADLLHSFNSLKEAIRLYTLHAEYDELRFTVKDEKGRPIAYLDIPEWSTPGPMDHRLLEIESNWEAWSRLSMLVVAANSWGQHKRNKLEALDRLERALIVALAAIIVIVLALGSI